MPRPPPDPDLIKLVLRALAAGRSHADVARAAGVGESTVQGWAKRYRARLDRLVARREAMAGRKPAEPQATPPAGTDSLAVSRAMRQEMIDRATAAAEVGNYSASQRFMRDAAAIQTVIARQEKAESTDRDAIRVPISEIAGAIDAARARVKALLARPLLCAHCSRELSVRWAEESQPETTPAPAPAKQRRSK